MISWVHFHHDYFRLSVFPSFRLSVLTSVCFFLASCGGGSGDNSISTNYEPRPSGTGPLTATGGGDGQGSKSENEQQQQIIIVNQEEEQQQEIVVNIQPEPEEESEEEEEENNNEEQKIVVNIQQEEDQNEIKTQDSGQESEPENDQESEKEENNNEETPQQLTIIEEPEPTYIPPEKEKPRYSAQTTCTGTCTTGTLHSYSYWLDVPNTPGASIISQNTKFASSGRNGSNYNFPDGSIAITARYHKANGFVAKYDYESNTGTFTSDVDLLFNYPKNGQPTIRGILGHNLTLESTKYGKYNFGNIYFDATVDTNTGTFSSQNVQFSKLTNSYLHVNRSKTTTSYATGTKVVTVTELPELRGVISGKNMNYKPSILSHNSFEPVSGVVHGTSSVRGSFSNDGTTGNNKAALPGQLVGEVEIKDFKLIGGESGNRLVGVFVGDKR